MNIKRETLKELRERTGAGIMDCKSTLVETEGNIEKAIELLRKKGIIKVEKKSGRITEEGQVTSYIHPGARLGTLVEITCETDFVARTPEFNELARNIAMQVAAANPLYISRDIVPRDIIEREKSIYEAQAKEQGKPDKIIPRIVEGKLENFYKDVCLLEQPFIKDPNKTVQELVKEYIAKFSENIIIKRFARFRIGE
jgi:elongation factor Ts